MFAESRFSIHAVANLCRAGIQNFSHMAHLLHLCDMPSCPIVSSDLRAHIPILCHVYGYSIQKICCVLGVGKTLVYKTLKVHWTLDGPHSLVLSGRSFSLFTLVYYLDTSGVEPRTCKHMAR